ncbi:MAG: UDP-glucose 4-epimerase GalE [Sphingomonadales bacterium]|nr:UDP-glucose 4-epimerase GalE [Sphingomonadales bacterium]
MKNILVTGGLGFIGSHTVVSLHEAGFNPIILDNLSNTRESVLDGLQQLMGKRPVFYQGDVNEAGIYDKIVSETGEIAAVIHFAAFKAVGESVEQPLKYYHNNVQGLITLLKAMEKQGIANIVFSSSCTVYGEPDHVPVNEASPTKPAASPYGATKQMGETILHDCAWLNTQCLRYFNPIGAHATGLIGELPLGVPSNLIPYLTQTVAGLRPPLTVHGGDYLTRDGTCIRDYIHVCDLADAHVAALNRLLAGEQESAFEVFNIGTGDGSSVLEVLNVFEEATGEKPKYHIGPRRPGDVVAVWADASRAETVLGWKAKRGLPEMLRDAWNWQIKQA